MYEKTKIIALITARGGSKRIPNKNTMKIGDASLVEKSIHVAKASKYIDEVYTSSDAKAIIEQAKHAGSKIIERPNELASDTASSLDVLKHALTIIEENEGKNIIIVLLQPTSPFRTVETVDKCIETMFEENADLVVSVSKRELEPKWILIKTDNGFVEFNEENTFSTIRAQDQKEYYELNGSVFCYKPEVITLSESYPFGKRVCVVPTSFKESIQIDEPEDLELVKLIIAGETKKNESHGPN